MLRRGNRCSERRGVEAEELTGKVEKMDRKKNSVIQRGWLGLGRMVAVSVRW